MTDKLALLVAVEQLHELDVLRKRVAQLEAELAAERRRREFVQTRATYLGWGFDTVESMHTEGADAAGVSVYSEVAPYHIQKLAFVRYSACDGDRARTEAVAIDQAITAYDTLISEESA